MFTSSTHSRWTRRRHGRTGLGLPSKWNTSYGGGFVIAPLMQYDVVNVTHWMSGAQFLNAVALGQVTPGPVVQTVAVVGHRKAAMGRAARCVDRICPSVVLCSGRVRHISTAFERVVPFSRFFQGSTGRYWRIAGSAIPLRLALGQLWQVPVLSSTSLALHLRRSCQLPADRRCAGRVAHVLVRV